MHDNELFSIQRRYILAQGVSQVKASYVNKVITIYNCIFKNEMLKVGINKGQGRTDVIRAKDILLN